MSQMIPSPPPSISIGGPGGPGAGPAGPGGPGGPGGPSAGGTPGPDSEKVKTLVTQAIDLLREAEPLEGDAADQAELAKAIASLRGYVGNQQKMVDSAMGAGPGVKLIRKTAQGA